MRRSPAQLWVAFVHVILAGWIVVRGLAAEPAADAPARVPFTTSKFVGSPNEPPPYKIVNAFPKLKFNHPVHIASAPGSDRLFVCEQAGKIVSFPNRKDVAQADVLLDAKRDLAAVVPAGADFENVFALAFHPKFTENRQCFVCYTVKDKGGKPNLENGTRISRFTVKPGDPPRIDPASEEIVITWLQGGHNGCDLQFGPDGFLYASAGDGEVASPPDLRHTGQDITDLMSSIIRIDVDRKDPGKNYAVPKDNPFIGLNVGDKDARPEVWAFGLRNPWRMSFDRATGDLWVGDVGWELWEMVHKIERGGNYGWSLVESRQPVHTTDRPGPTPVRPPVIELPHTDAASVTGGFVYHGKKFPDLDGAYVFGDYMTRRVWAARMDGNRLKSLVEITEPSLRLIAFCEDRDGELFLMDYDSGTVHTLEKNEVPAAQSGGFPRTLSATGLFASAKDHAVAPGVYRFGINTPQWQDHATSEHFVALPGTSTVTHFEPKKSLPGHVDWMQARYHFPQDGLLVKTISLDTEQGNPASRKRVETQVLHWDGLNYRPYTYAWRDDQTDADLVPSTGAEKRFEVKDAQYVGGKREQMWQFHSRTQCIQCHNSWAEYALAFNPEQLNSPTVAGAGAGSGNQLVRFEALGLLKRVGRGDRAMPPLTESDAAKQRKLTDPYAADAPVALRARSYLHANCAHCHRNGGGGSVDLQLVAFDDPRRLKVIDVLPRQGGFDLPDARIIATGKPYQSVLLYRMAKFGRGRMPHFGSELVDEKGVAVVRQWIESLVTGSGNAGRTDAAKLSQGDLEAQLGSTTKALELACAMGDGCPPDVRQRILAAGAKVPPGNVRDLFDGYLPQTGERKLGPNPRPQTVLAPKGDAARGRELFAAERMQCAKCHKIDGAGAEVGPDLSTIGKLRPREDILESLLEPTRRVEPAFQAYLVRTLDGRALTGLLVKRDANEVVLKDGQGKEIRLPTGDVETVQPSRESIMPSGALADLTAQQAADLLEFLASRKEARP